LVYRFLGHWCNFPYKDISKFLKKKGAGADPLDFIVDGVVEYTKPGGFLTGADICGNSKFKLKFFWNTT